MYNNPMVRARHRFILLSCAALLAIAICAAFAQGNPSAAAYAHASIAGERGGTGAEEYWIFTPKEPRPKSGPVIVFMHGWGGMDPYVYGAWITHLVRSGNIVIYPRYQANIKTKLADMTPNALRALKNAYARLLESGPVRPDGRLALVGHSMGGFLAANLAALAPANGLPAPAALMVIAPGDGDRRMQRLGRLGLEDMGGAPASMLLLVVGAEEDGTVGYRGANKIWNAAKESTIADKAYVTLRSDRTARPKLIADHVSALAVDPEFDAEFSLYRPGDTPADQQRKGLRGLIARRKAARSERLANRARNFWDRNFEADALDYDGYWKLFDDLLDAAFAGPESKQAASAKKVSPSLFFEGLDANQRLTRHDK